MGSFATLDRLLEHVVEVETEMIGLSAQAHRQIAAWVGSSGILPGDEVLEALQYQDILSQQLGATIEAVQAVRGHLASALCAEGESDADLAALDAKLVEILERAQTKRSAFRGRADGEAEEIEFF